MLFINNLHMLELNNSLFYQQQNLLENLINYLNLLLLLNLVNDIRAYFNHY